MGQPKPWNDSLLCSYALSSQSLYFWQVSSSISMVASWRMHTHTYAHTHVCTHTRMHTHNKPTTRTYMQKRKRKKNNTPTKTHITPTPTHHTHPQHAHTNNTPTHTHNTHTWKKTAHATVSEAVSQIFGQNSFSELLFRARRHREVHQFKSDFARRRSSQHLHVCKVSGYSLGFRQYHLGVSDALQRHFLVLHNDALASICTCVGYQDIL